MYFIERRCLFLPHLRVISDAESDFRRCESAFRYFFVKSFTIGQTRQCLQISTNEISRYCSGYFHIWRWGLLYQHIQWNVNIIFEVLVFCDHLLGLGSAIFKSKIRKTIFVNKLSNAWSGRNYFLHVVTEVLTILSSTCLMM